MKKIIDVIILVVILFLAGGCGTGAKYNDISPIAEDVKQTPGTSPSLSIRDGVAVWDPGSKCCESFEDTLLEVPFEVPIPKVPFPITHQSADIVPANFDLIQLTFANEERGEQLILAVSNSQVKSKPDGKKGPKLSDGTQTWIQSTPNLSGLYWRNNGLTYALASNKVEDGDFVPLYSISELVQIANSIVQPPHL
ncbi:MULTISPECIES: hypothetical protein [Paenibacillus]|uniref:DUF4367 domain-containing protein n=1 Tax=Paenibacillus barengoltzii J12 TaxID=935846 RepID=A0ABY1M417_9BACL|nr:MULTISPECIES: hypothetical protein [Paenibacillus]MDU0330539.1 hypothetical protein [Paenibacillus sp. 3LSP]SMF70410.1 hypothetical protein SAMN02744124_04431 [Paenibacillus barengoltzii J12]